MHAYLLPGSDGWTVVDTGLGLPDARERWARVLAEAGGPVARIFVTHFHPDHVGGTMMGWGIEGIVRLIELTGVPVHVQAEEAPWVERTTGVGASELSTHHGGDVVTIGEVPVTLLHTPGPTPGSQCFLVDGKLVAGDTLFLDGCGRTDLPGGDPAALYESLTTRLARVPDDTVLYPGHLYSPDSSATMGFTREHNYVFRLRSPEQWMTMFGN